MSNLPSTISATGLCFAYAGEDVLHDVSAELVPGSILGIAGANGSGKSTLVSILAGLRRPRRGTIERHGPVALVVQRAAAPDSLPLTVQDVVLMGTWRRRLPRRESRRMAAEALSRVRMEGFENRPFAALSGGQRQRVLLAQALAQNAPTLLLDEPAAGLDAASRQRIHQVLREEALRGCAVAMVSHDSHELAIADQILHLEPPV